MNRLGGTTTTTTTTTKTIRSPSDLYEKEKSRTAFHNKDIPKKGLFKPTTTTTPTRTGGFYDKKTLWEQEIYRYHPSFWLLIRIGSLIAFPYLTSALGKHAYPRISEMAEEHGMDMKTAAPPLLSFMALSAFFVHNAFYAILYHFEPKSFEKYRVDEKPWHWDMEPEKWNAMLRRTIGLVLFNFLCITFPLAYLQSLVVGTPVRTDTTSLPGGLELFWQLLFCLVMEDFGFHHTHQLLHTKQFYWIHKIHHQYHAPIGMAAAYAHPIEYVFGNILPSVLGPAILRERMHLWTMGVWACFRLSAATENHSGYEFPWSMYQAIPFKAPTEYHDFHHNRNQGTYSGVLRFWDWVYGTNQEYFEWVRAGRPETLKSLKFKQKNRAREKSE